ncbi:MAG: hypothetical protein R3E79_26670 [Caldilineaceae bacterium]
MHYPARPGHGTFILHGDDGSVPFIGWNQPVEEGAALGVRAQRAPRPPLSKELARTGEVEHIRPLPLPARGRRRRHTLRDHGAGGGNLDDIALIKIIPTLAPIPEAVAAGQGLFTQARFAQRSSAGCSKRCSIGLVERRR